MPDHSLKGNRICAKWLLTSSLGSATGLKARYRSRRGEQRVNEREGITLSPSAQSSPHMHLPEAKGRNCDDWLFPPPPLFTPSPFCLSHIGKTMAKPRDCRAYLFQKNNSGRVRSPAGAEQADQQPRPLPPESSLRLALTLYSRRWCMCIAAGVLTLRVPALEPFACLADQIPWSTPVRPSRPPALRRPSSLESVSPAMPSALCGTGDGSASFHELAGAGGFLLDRSLRLRSNSG